MYTSIRPAPPILIHHPKTRSGKSFAAWDGPHVIPSNPHFDLESLLKDGIDAHDAWLASNDLDELDYGLFYSSSPLTSPEPSPFPSPRMPSASLPPCPSVAVAPSPPNDLPSQALPSEMPTRCDEISDYIDHHDDNGPSSAKKARNAKNKAQSRANRQKKRAAEQAAVFSHLTARPKVIEKYVDARNATQTSVHARGARVARTAYVALDDHQRTKKMPTLAELVGDGSKYNFTLQKCGEGKPRPLVSNDPEKYIIGVIAGCPPDKDWPHLMTEGAEALHQANIDCIVANKDRRHRRGAFTALRCGVSHGGGQRRPGNLTNTDENAAVLDKLNALEPFRRLSGFATAVMATWAPKLYNYYVDRLGALHAHDPLLHRIFPSSIFAAASYNLGPRTACHRHVDFANLPFGWCAITALGSYDYTKGGHLILWDCHLVIEFPPGWTILIPSAIISHSNTTVSSHETRYSFAQYTAGGLFRWADNGFQTSDDFRAGLTEEELACEEEKSNQRWAFGLSLFQTLDDITKNYVEKTPGAP